jgi:hypothetical protein
LVSRALVTISKPAGDEMREERELASRKRADIGAVEEVGIELAHETTCHGTVIGPGCARSAEPDVGLLGDVRDRHVVDALLDDQVAGGID